MMNENERLINLYNEAYKFAKKEVGEEILNENLKPYKKDIPTQDKPADLTDVFIRMLKTLRNRQGYPNFIVKIEKLKQILLNFYYNKILEKYDNWEDLFNDLRIEFENEKKFDINNKRNAWVMYSKGILSSAKFLLNFKDLEEFDSFVNIFLLNEFTIASLPMLLSTEIHGFGFPLACDFLKELGYSNYAKPDVHLKDIFFETGIVDEKNDYEVFKKIIKISSLVKEEPSYVDKLFWYIGSGKFYHSKSEVIRKNLKSKFIHNMKNKFKKM